MKMTLVILKIVRVGSFPTVRHCVKEKLSVMNNVFSTSDIGK